jgi:two-component system sensor histidine kinase/response regulator
MDHEKRMRILAVDDSPANGDIIIGCFGRDHNVSVATNGKDALSLLDRISPDIILLDILMPGMDGFAVASEIRRRKELESVPIIFLTVLTDSGEIVKGFQSGASDYITKPFDVDELISRVNFHLELKEKGDRILKQNEEQRELLHVLTHDLANTFMSIGAFSHSFEDLSARDGIHLDNIRRSVRNGTEVIQMVRMLDCSCSDLETVSLDLQECLESSLLILRPLYDGKDLKISLAFPPGLRVRAERVSLLNSVLNNVLTNAIKFSHAGTEIAVWAEEEGDRVMLHVQDWGVGMREEDLEDHFHVHRNSSCTGTCGEEGTGFGMPLIRKFMKAYGGTVSIRSKDAARHPEEHGTIVSMGFLKGEA